MHSLFFRMSFKIPFLSSHDSYFTSYMDERRLVGWMWMMFGNCVEGYCLSIYIEFFLFFFSPTARLAREAKAIEWNIVPNRYIYVILCMLRFCWHLFKKNIVVRLFCGGSNWVVEAQLDFQDSYLSVFKQLRPIWFAIWLFCLIFSCYVRLISYSGTAVCKWFN